MGRRFVPRTGVTTSQGFSMACQGVSGRNLLFLSLKTLESPVRGRHWRCGDGHNILWAPFQIVTANFIQPLSRCFLFPRLKLVNVGTLCVAIPRSVGCEVINDEQKVYFGLILTVIEIQRKEESAPNFLKSP